MRIYGHRGAAALAPENTLEGFRAALSCCDGFECDVRATLDGRLVLMHDGFLERTTEGTGRLGERVFDEVRALDAAYRFRPDLGYPLRGRGVVVATVEEALREAAGRGRVILELKALPFEPGYDPDEPVARALGGLLGAGARGDIVVSSFNPFALKVFRGLAPDVPTALLVPAALEAASGIDGAAAAGHKGCHLAEALVDAPAVARARDAGLEVVAWTVNDPARVRAFDGWGVDGIIADDPVAAVEALRASGERRVLGVSRDEVDQASTESAARAVENSNRDASPM
ncbi:MAG: glycerophosphodiester phosphodiesterase [Acidobacteria bacterium]|nr:glycerophosphodiester phosphodiesterase [Acidobacteriota bacterium]